MREIDTLRTGGVGEAIEDPICLQKFNALFTAYLRKVSEILTVEVSATNTIGNSEADANGAEAPNQIKENVNDY